jgi:hypothetical protein
MTVKMNEQMIFSEGISLVELPRRLLFELYNIEDGSIVMGDGEILQKRYHFIELQ